MNKYIKPIWVSAAVLVVAIVLVANFDNFRGLINNGGSEDPNPTILPEITNPADEESVEKEIITLYYANSNADKVAAEKREVEIKKDTQIERLVFEELQKDPKSEGLYSVIPEGTKLLSASTKDSICTLDLSKEFVDNHPGGSAGELMTLYSIINTITELPGIDKVQFLIEGQKQEVYIHAVFNEPFKRNDKLIKTNLSELTFMQYWDKFVYDHDFANAEKVA